MKFNLWGLKMTQPLYVFDMDETLIDADCAMLWNAFLVRKGIIAEPGFLEQDQRLMRLYAQGKMDMEDYLEFSIAPLASLPVEEVNRLVEECVLEEILVKQFTQSKDLIEQLRQQQVQMVIISASVSFLVSVVGHHIGIDNTLGIDLVTKQGCYTPEISGIASYREGKVLRLKEWIESQPECFSEIHFYTDSINDLPLCEFADYAYLVNPCPALKAYSDQENWQVLEWSVR